MQVLSDDLAEGAAAAAIFDYGGAQAGGAAVWEGRRPSAAQARIFSTSGGLISASLPILAKWACPLAHWTCPLSEKRKWAWLHFARIRPQLTRKTSVGWPSTSACQNG